MTKENAGPQQDRLLRLIQGFGAVANWWLIIWGGLVVISGLIQLSWVIVVVGFVFLALGLVHRSTRTMKNDDIADYQASRSRKPDEPPSFPGSST